MKEVRYGHFSRDPDLYRRLLAVDRHAREHRADEYEYASHSEVRPDWLN